MVNLSRIFLILFNFIILVIGICAIALSWYVLSYSSLPAELQFLQGAKVVMYAGLVLGTLLFVIGLTGGLGAAAQNIALLKSYVFIFTLVVLLEIAVGVYIYVMDEEEILVEVWEKMDDVSRDLVHSQLKCCGFKSTSEYSEEVPLSCTDTDTGQQYDISCYTRLWTLIDNNIITSIASVATVFLVQIFSIFLAIYNFKSIRNRVSRIAGRRTAWEL